MASSSMARKSIAEILFDILQDHPDIFCWNALGTAFTIKANNAEMTAVLKNYFTTKNPFAAFHRQLIALGFQKLKYGSDCGAYAHEDFLRDDPSRWQRVKKKLDKNSKTKTKNGGGGGGGGGSEDEDRDEDEDNDDDHDPAPPFTASGVKPFEGFLFGAMGGANEVEDIPPPPPPQPADDQPPPWLELKGFDPGDLTRAVRAVRNPRIVSTAMYEACVQGELDIAKWIYAHGGAETIRTQDNLGQCPMYVACREGFLDVCKWLFEMGAAEDIRTPDICGATPLYTTAWRGHLDVGRWLFAMGAAADATTRTVPTDNFPLLTAVRNGHLHMIKWLVDEAGAEEDLVASDTGGMTPLRTAWRIMDLSARAPAKLQAFAPLTCWLLERGAAAAVARGPFDQEVGRRREKKKKQEVERVPHLVQSLIESPPPSIQPVAGVQPRRLGDEAGLRHVKAPYAALRGPRGGASVPRSKQRQLLHLPPRHPEAGRVGATARRQERLRY